MSFVAILVLFSELMILMQVEMGIQDLLREFLLLPRLLALPDGQIRRDDGEEPAGCVRG